MRILELCACEGGATAGYQRAGFEAYAVDLDRNRLKYSPAEGHLIADALDVLVRLLNGEAIDFLLRDGSEVSLRLEDFDAIHVSPPCQYYTRGNARLRSMQAAWIEPPETLGGWPRLIPTFRGLLESTRLPYVIENVQDAGWDMLSPVSLCGCMFDLSTTDTDGVRIHLKRERLFEANWDLTAPRPCDHDGIEQWAGAYGGARRDKHEARTVRKGGYVPADKEVVKALLGIEHHMTWQGLFESIPPAYAEHVGRQLAAHVEGMEKAVAS